MLLSLSRLTGNQLPLVVPLLLFRILHLPFPCSALNAPPSPPTSTSASSCLSALHLFSLWLFFFSCALESTAARLWPQPRKPRAERFIIRLNCCFCYCFCLWQVIITVPCQLVPPAHHSPPSPNKRLSPRTLQMGFCKCEQYQMKGLHGYVIWRGKKKISWWGDHIL